MTCVSAFTDVTETYVAHVAHVRARTTTERNYFVSVKMFTRKLIRAFKTDLSLDWPLLANG